MIRKIKFIGLIVFALALTILLSPVFAGASAVMFAPAADTYTYWKTVDAHTDLSVVLRVAFSPDGRLLMSSGYGSDPTVKIWDVEKSALVRMIATKHSQLTAAALSPDGRLLATGSQERIIKIWDAQTGALIKTLGGDGRFGDGRVNEVAFSSDGKTLAIVTYNTGSGKVFLTLCDAATGNILKAVETGHTGYEYDNSVVFSPDNQTVATGGGKYPNGPGELMLWNIRDCTRRLSLGHSTFIGDVKFSPDGKTIATATTYQPTGSVSANEILIWDAATGAIAKRLASERLAVREVAFSPNGRGLVSVGYGSHTWKLWDLQTGAVVQSGVVEGGRGFGPVAFSSDGAFMAFGEVGGSLPSGRVHIWRRSPGGEVPPGGTGLTLKSSNLFGGNGNQKGTGLSISGGRLYVSGGDAGKYPGGQSLAASFALPVMPDARPAWKTAWPDPSSSRHPDHEIFNGVASSDQGSFFAGAGWTQTSDNVGDKESKSILVKFSANGPADTNVGGAGWIAKPEFFRNYWGWEVLNASIASKEGDQTYIYVTGRAQSNGANNTAVLAKYDADGKLIWSMPLGDPGYTKNSGGSGLAIANGRVYVGGSSHYPYTDPTARRAILWTCDFSKGGKLAYSAPLPAGVMLSGASSVAASGSVVYLAAGVDRGSSGGKGVVVQKYDFSQSNYLGWSKIYDGSGNDYGIAADGKKVYVVGEKLDGATKKKAALLLEIDAATGKQLSATTYDGDGDDIPRAVALDGSDIYVVGESGNASGQTDVMLLRYQAQGAPVPPPVKPPVADAGPDRTVEKDTWGAKAVALDGSASYDPNVPPLVPLTFRWWQSPAPYRFSNPTDVRPTIHMTHLGTHIINLEVTNTKRLTAKDSVVLLLRDTVKPVLRVKLTPPELWPPNNKLVPVMATVVATDSCDPKPRVSLVSIKTGPPHPGVKGPYVSDAYYGTDDRAFKLLAAKGTTGDSRVYTIVYRATDSSGNSSYDTALVVVPHSKGKPQDKGGTAGGSNNNRSGLGDGTNPGQGSGTGNSPNQGTNNPNQSGGSGKKAK